MRRILQEHTRFDASLVWHLQDEWVEHAGARAWTGSFVPEGATSNRLRATAIARFLVALADDLAPTGPVRVMEVACGSGAFASNLIAALREDLGAPGTALAARLTYLMTDLTDATVRAAALRPRIASAIAEGLVQTAVLDASDAGSLRTLGGKPLEGGCIAILANYLACVLPARHVLKRPEGTFELHVETAVLVEPEGEILDLKWSWQPGDARDPFWQSEAVPIMVDACAELEESRVCWPGAFFAVTEALQGVAAPGAALVISDYGTVRTLPSETRSWRPRIYGGSVAAGVDFRVVSGFCQARGWSYLGTADPAAALHTAVISWDGPLPEDSRQSFVELFEREEPGRAFMDLVRAAEISLRDPDSTLPVRLLRRAAAMSPAEPGVWISLAESLSLLHDHEAAMAAVLQAEQHDADDEFDLALERGKVLAAADQLPEALAAFKQSLTRTQAPQTWGFVALILEQLGLAAEGRDAARRALEGDPSLAHIAACLERLEKG